MTNHLYYGDNLRVLRDHIGDGSVDLIYLDPPFNSNASYNVLFRSPTGDQSAAQIEAFDDTWHWGDEAESAFQDVRRSGHTDAATMLEAMRSFLGTNDMMAYLAMMAVRLIELHRVLKPTGSLYLHCDPTASHYLKILLDAVFDPRNYRNELIWRRFGSHNDAKHGFAAVHDTIFLYGRSKEAKFNQQFEAQSAEYLERSYRHSDDLGRVYRIQNLASPSPRPNLTYYYTALNGVTYEPHPNGWKYSPQKMRDLDEQGRLAYPSKPSGRLSLKNYLDEMRGKPLADVWNDLPSLSGSHAERLGYPTQKPVALLERILNASSNPGDVVLDPFCGCGTTVHAAQKLNRRWIGIDVTHLAIGLIERRLREAFGADLDFKVHGTPQDLAAAQDMFDRDDATKKEFEKWAVSLIGAQPWRAGRKGADGGIDGRLAFGKSGVALVSVKGGKDRQRNHIDQLRAVIDREKADVGIFLSLHEPTAPMRAEAAGAGQFAMDGFAPVPRIQIVTIADAMRLRDRAVQLPLARDDNFRKPAREEDATRQGSLGL